MDLKKPGLLCVPPSVAHPHMPRSHQWTHGHFANFQKSFHCRQSCSDITPRRIFETVQMICTTGVGKGLCDVVWSCLSKIIEELWRSEAPKSFLDLSLRIFIFIFFPILFIYFLFANLQNHFSPSRSDLSSCTSPHWCRMQIRHQLATEYSKSQESKVSNTITKINTIKPVCCSRTFFEAFWELWEGQRKFLWKISSGELFFPFYIWKFYLCPGLI